MDGPKLPSKPIVFMYHGVIKEDAGIPPSRERGAELYDVRLKDFYGQMEFLNRHNYQVTTFPSGPSATQPKIVMTFDDGEMNEKSGIDPKQQLLSNIYTNNSFMN